MLLILRWRIDNECTFTGPGLLSISPGYFVFWHDVFFSLRMAFFRLFAAKRRRAKRRKNAMRKEKNAMPKDENEIAQSSQMFSPC